MADFLRDFWLRETGTGQQVAQLHDRYIQIYDDDDDDDDDISLPTNITPKITRIFAWPPPCELLIHIPQNCRKRSAYISCTCCHTSFKKPNLSGRKVAVRFPIG
jgi:hypothetical protein